jgi:hypothetical protein
MKPVQLFLIIATLISFNACSTLATQSGAGSTGQAQDSFRYPYNSPHW